MATSVWSEHYTKEGRVYYYNRTTQQSSWEKPADFDGEPAAKPTASSSSSSSSKRESGVVEWEELWDPKNERAYYYNRATRKTQWQRPENVEIKPYAGATQKQQQQQQSGSSSSSSRKDKHTKKAEKAAAKSAADGAVASASGKQEQQTVDAKEDIASGRRGSVSSSHGGSTPTGQKKHHHHHHHHHHHKKDSAAAVKEEISSVQDAESENGNGNTNSARAAESQHRSISDAHQDTAAMDETGDGGVAQKGATANGQEVTTPKKKKKKVKRDKGGDGDGSSAIRKKRRRDSEKRMIICDDEDEMNDRNRNNAIQEKDTEDGKEATRLLQELSKTDAIMDVNVLNVINGFLRAHNESNGPEILVEKLSSSYRGHAQMIGLVASWLDTLPVSKTALENKVTFDVSEGAVIKNKGASWDPAEDILYEHFKNIVNQHYDPKLVSNVLSGSVTEPEWLTQMLNDRKWRKLLIELAETHKSCGLLQYAIRRISEAGHHKEIASISNAHAFFPVFNGVLLDAFCRIPFASEEEVREDMNALNKICCQSAYSYLYAEELLCSMDNKLYLLQKSAEEQKQQHVHYRTVRSKLNRVRFELQETAFEKFGGKIEAFHPLRRRYLFDANPRLSDAILSIVKTKKCSGLAAEVLASQYKTAKNPPPVAHLRDPMVLRCLLDPLFNSSDSISSAFTQNCVFLLAYSASTKDERSILQPPSASERVEVDNEGVEKTKKALIEASAICKSDHTLGYNMNQSGVVDKLISVMTIPVVSMGVLHWLEVTLKSPAFFNSTLLNICFPSLLRILKASIKRHIAQWPIAFQVLVTALRLHPEINPVKALELKRESLRCMVFMITSGYVLPVLEFVFTNTLELDQALLRNFITDLFAHISPPYSRKFVVALSKILTHPKVQTAIKTCPLDCKTKLKSFVNYCKKNSGLLLSDQLHALVGIIQEG